MENLTNKEIFNFIEFKSIGAKAFDDQNDINQGIWKHNVSVRYSDNRLFNGWIWADINDGLLSNIKTNIRTIDTNVQKGMRVEDFMSIMRKISKNRSKFHMTVGPSASMIRGIDDAKIYDDAANSDVWLSKPLSGNKTIDLIFIGDALEKVIIRNYFVELP